MNKKTIWGVIITVIVGVVAAAIGINVNISLQADQDGFNAEIKMADQQVPAVIEGDQGELLEITETEGEEIKTVEEIDGGQFKDKDTGVSITDGQYADLGWSEWYPTDTPEAFKDATIGHCVIANNYFGAQCVSLARVFWWSYADRDVSTCGTGMAKGMMNCWQENAGDDFEVYWTDAVASIQAGDWLIFDGGQFGHVGMALGPVVNGYVALLGENQGGASCGANVGGSATNIINISVKNLIGYYRPKAYIKPAPAPEPEPEPIIDKCLVWDVQKGDTMGKVMLACEGSIKWGAAMDTYANEWKSKQTGNSVFYGWTHGTGYGLFAGDTITRSGV